MQPSASGISSGSACLTIRLSVTAGETEGEKSKKESANGHKYWHHAPVGGPWPKLDVEWIFGEGGPRVLVLQMTSVSLNLPACRLCFEGVYRGGGFGLSEPGMPSPGGAV